jgi:hypothetical protein
MMSNKIKKTIYLPKALAIESEMLALAEGMSLSDVIEAALRSSRIQRRASELRDIQGYWTRVAQARGILTDRDLARYLNS